MRRPTKSLDLCWLRARTRDSSHAALQLFVSHTTVHENALMHGFLLVAFHAKVLKVFDVVATTHALGHDVIHLIPWLQRLAAVVTFVVRHVSHLPFNIRRNTLRLGTVFTPDGYVAHRCFVLQSLELTLQALEAHFLVVVCKQRCALNGTSPLGSLRWGIGVEC